MDLDVFEASCKLHVYHYFFNCIYPAVGIFVSCCLAIAKGELLKKIPCRMPMGTVHILKTDAPEACPNKATGFLMIQQLIERRHGDRRPCRNLDTSHILPSSLSYCTYCQENSNTPPRSVRMLLRRTNKPGALKQACRFQRYDYTGWLDSMLQ